MIKDFRNDVKVDQDKGVPETSSTAVISNSKKKKCVAGWP